MISKVSASLMGTKNVRTEESNLRLPECDSCPKKELRSLVWQVPFSLLEHLDLIFGEFPVILKRSIRHKV